MKSGVMNGYGAMIEGLIKKIMIEMKPAEPEDIAIIATGGMAPLIKPYAPSIQRVDPDLTLTGLFFIFSALQQH
jgi:type III pantothenate kinase